MLFFAPRQNLQPLPPAIKDEIAKKVRVYREELIRQAQGNQFGPQMVYYFIENHKHNLENYEMYRIANDIRNIHLEDGNYRPTRGVYYS